MYKTLDQCLKAWDESIQYGSKQDRIKRNQLWIDYYRYMAQQNRSNRLENEYHFQLVDFLKRENVIDLTSSVLDIGSGIGNFALEFGKNVSSVHAIDMEQDSLFVLNQRALELGLSNLSTQMSMWENYISSIKYDVAFTSMCPAICNQEEILRMESLSNQYCVIVAVNRGSYDFHRKELMKLLPVKQNAGFTSEAVWYYDALYLMERQPNVKTWEQLTEYDITLEKAIEQYIVYFKVFGYKEAISRPIVTEYLTTHSQNNIVHEKSKMVTSCIYWKVPN